jgi:OmpA-OmpF porin, OOP family
MWRFHGAPKSPPSKPRQPSPGDALRASSAFTAAAILGTVLAGAGPSFADGTPSLALEPAPAGDRGFAVERARVRGHLLVSARLLTDYAREPLVLQNAAQQEQSVVEEQLWFHALGSFYLWHRLAVGLDVPFVPLQGSGSIPASGRVARAAAGAEFGDLRVAARAKLLGTDADAEHSVDFAVATAVWFPTGTSGYAGDGVVRARATLVLEGESRRLYWAINAGVRSRPYEELPGILPTRVGTALVLGAGAGFFADGRRRVAIGTEATAETTLTGGTRPFDPRGSVVHWFVTGHYRILGGPLEVGAAFGPGLMSGAGNAAFRGLALVGFAPERPPAPPDRDDDGVPDRRDACPDQPGVPSRDALLHGCPEAPSDRDGDGIPDVNDACPMVPGEASRLRKHHGCPKPVDTDGDGVPDPEDACPEQAGLAPPKGNGCPAPATPPSAQLVEQEIIISQQVQFETGTAVLLPASDPILVEVARVLREHPEIEAIEVRGHTDDTGPPALNRQLGQERAARVVRWLVEHGISQSRLSAKGFGSDQPIADNATEEGRARNRRVEFRVMKRGPAAPRKEGATP